jgi:hypothetical protein
MGYTTEFKGSISVSPPLSTEEIEFLKKFAGTRRMDRKKGPYFVDGTGFAGQGHDPDIRDYNSPPPGQPGLWCQWVPNADGTAIEWDGGEKFYDSVGWMKYLVDHFIGSDPIAASELPFLKPHVLNGVILAQGEDEDDRWHLVVADNVVGELRGHPAALPGPAGRALPRRF